MSYLAIRRLAFVAALTLNLAGNGGAQPPGGRPLSFDAASVKPSPADRRGGFPYRIGPNTLSIQGRLLDLIVAAWEVRPYQVEGIPALAQSQFYDVQAKAEGEADKPQIRAMLQTLLSERFHLKYHRQTQARNGYVLSVEKGGPKLPPPRTDLPPDSTGVVQMGGGVWSRGATLSQVAYGLSLALGEPVIDETAIPANYDFRLRFDEGDDAALESVFTAVREFGLRLDGRKVPIELLIVDSVEPPSAN